MNPEQKMILYFFAVQGETVNEEVELFTYEDALSIYEHHQRIHPHTPIEIREF